MLDLESVSTQFDIQWKAGQRPQLETFLEEVSRAAQESSFTQLLGIELRWRLKRGESPRPDDYVTRFDQFRSQIDEAFETLRAGELDTSAVSLQSTSSFRKDRSVPAGGASGNAPTIRKLAEGSVLGHFEILESIGEGSFGGVRRACDTRLDRMVALKTPRLGTLSDELDVQRFLREARAAAQLRHPHIVPVHEAGECEGVYYIASELIDGQTLRDALHDPNPFNAKQSVQLVAKLAAALHYAHQKGIIHRDVKPENIMIDESGEPHMMDFGLARREEPDVLRTQAGVRMGTPAYMSPEQAKGDSHTADARSDLWSLGVVLFELLTGQRPFQGTGGELMQQILDSEPPLLRSLDPSLSKDLETICAKCLAKRPEHRYASCQHLAEELERWLRGEPIVARPVGTAEQMIRWCRRNPVPSALTALIGISLVAGTIVSTYFAVEAFTQAEVAGASAAFAHTQEQLAQQSASEARQSADLARQREAEARQSLYFADVDLARQMLESGDVQRATRYLETHIPQTGEADLRRFEWQYLWRRRHGESSSLLWPHPGDGSGARHIRAVAVTADDRAVLVAGGRPHLGEVHRYPREDEQPDWQIDEKLPVVNALAQSSDGSRVAAGCGSHQSQGIVQVWDAEAGSSLMTLKTEFPVTSLSFTQDGRWLVTGSARLTTGRGAPVDRYFTTDNQARPDLVKVWHAETGELVASLPGDTYPICSVAVSADGQTIAAGDVLGSVHFWDAESREYLGKVDTHLRYAWSLAFSPDSKTLAVGAGFWDEAGAVSLYDVQERRLKRLLRGHQAGVTCVRFGPDGNLLASGSWDRTIKLWDLTAPTSAAATCYGHTAHVWSIDFTSDGKTLVSGGWGATTAGSLSDSEVKYWNVDQQRRFFRAPQPLKDLGTYQGHDWAGPTVATVDESLKSLQVWDAATGTMRKSFEPFDGSGIRSVSVSPDGQWIATSGFSPTSKIWDARSQQLVAELPSGTAPYLTFSPDGSRLAVACDDGRVLLYEMQQEVLIELSGHTDVVWWLDFTPDSQRLASGSWDHTVKIWDTQSGRSLTTLTGHHDVVWKVAWLFGEGTLLSESTKAGIWEGAVDAPRVDPTEFRLGTDKQQDDLPRFEIEQILRPKSYVWLGLAHERRGDPESADACYRRALLIMRRRVEECPLVPKFRVLTFNEILDLRNFFAQQADQNRVGQLVEMAALLIESSPPSRDASPFDRLLLGRKLKTLGAMRLAQKQRDTAMDCWKRAREWLLPLEEEATDEVDVDADLADCENSLAWELVFPLDATSDERQRGLELAQSAAERVPGNAAYWNTLGAAYYRNQQWNDAKPALDRSCELAGAGNAFDWLFLAMTHWQLGDHDQAKKRLQQAKDWRVRYAPRDPKLIALESEARKLIQED